MKDLALLLLLPLVFTAPLYAAEAATQQKFLSGGTIRLHLEAGAYTIRATDSDQIIVTCQQEDASRLRRVRVEIKPSASTAEVDISNTPNNNFSATIEVPRRSNLWGRLSAGELVVEAVEGDKNFEVVAGRIQIEIAHPEEYGHCDASVTAGSIESSAFDVEKGGLFRSFDQQGPGKYRLHAHVMTGEIDLRGTN